MKINEMFVKPIDRPIETVIKAADDDHLAMELEEYVVTPDIARNIQDLMAAYNDYDNANGVWISGHFGSGKSHLLKMLAHLLGDVQDSSVPREKFVEFFQDKVGEEYLGAEIRRSSRIPAKSILFNVDDKADVSNKDRADALLGVFQRVFDDARGYFGSDRAVARLEADLDQAGLFAQFQEAFESLTGTPWIEGRETALFMSADIDQAYAQVRNEGVSTGILDRYEAHDTLTIEGFAKEVAAWLDAQDDPNLRLNFFVDEIGQYIGSSTPLMLNLQTIAENLNTHCKGRSFVFVTSQEALEGIIGHRSKRSGEDFSKIKDRFRTSLKLESQDVEEVVSRRLLTKTDDASNRLAAMWNQDRVRLKNLFEFRDNARTYNNYKNQAAFIDTYPFVNYQFSLFQDALTELSTHDAFEGHHSSAGARNLLSVAQQATRLLGDEPVGTLVSFDLMFEGVRRLLRGTSFKSVRQGEEQFGKDSLEARLLRALFLVKYVEHFKATPRNLAVLLFGDIDVNVPQLEAEVETALTRLVTNTYIRQEQDRYAYLTNEEQDIEREIYNTDVSPGEETTELVAMLAGDILKGQKFRYQPTGQDFRYQLRINGDRRGTEAPLSISFLTDEDPNDPTRLKVDYAGANELAIILDPNDRFFKDFLRWTRASKYLRYNSGRGTTSSVKSIVQQKRSDTEQLRKALEDQLKELIATSLMLVQGREIKPRQSGDSARDRLDEGLERVVANTYTSLPVLGGRTYSEHDIKRFLSPGGQLQIDEAGMRDPIASAADDLLGFVRGVSQGGTQVTIARVVDKYEGVPYGWDLVSIEAVIAYLLGRKELRLEVDGRKIPLTRAYEPLTKTRDHRTAVLRPVVKHDPAQVQKLQVFIKKYTDIPSTDQEAEALAARVQEGFDEELQFIKEQRTRVSDYPFLADLDEVASRIQAARNHQDDWFVETFAGSDTADQLLEDQEDLTRPIREFMRGGQSKIFDNARTFFDRNMDNLKHLDEAQVETAQKILADPAPFRGREDKFTELKRAHAALASDLDARLNEEKAEAEQAIHAREEEILNSKYYENARPSAQAKVEPEIREVLARVRSARTIDAVQVEAGHFDSHGHTNLLAMLAAAPEVSEPTGPEDEPKPVKPKTVITLQTVQEEVRWNRGPLQNMDDVNDYMDELWRRLQQALEDGSEVIVK